MEYLLRLSVRVGLRSPPRVSTPARPSDRPTLFFRSGSASFSKPSSTKQNLRFDREARPRAAYSLRHTYICLRLMEGPDIYQIAKNCRISVEMIEKY
jgi:hypothetical protein